MRGRKLVGWNGCRKKRFRAAFWFKLTELIFTVSHSNDRASILCPGPGHPLSVNPMMFDEGKKKIPTANSVWSAPHLTLYFVYKTSFQCFVF